SYSLETRTALRQVLARPAQQKSLVSPDGFFMIHYDTVGVHAVSSDDEDASGTPDYVENLARYADSSYRMEVLQMGYLPPPPTGTACTTYTRKIWEPACTAIPSR
ncbi:MAG: hypothetical protein L0209_09825, partial [candidate division Zixibacteria bacterium]|nr:hypothetical protein [candidate division Zixibacteria bacterium]